MRDGTEKTGSTEMAFEVHSNPGNLHNNSQVSGKNEGYREQPSARFAGDQVGASVTSLASNDPAKRLIVSFGLDEHPAKRDGGGGAASLTSSSKNTNHSGGSSLYDNRKNLDEIQEADARQESSTVVVPRSTRVSGAN